MSQEAIHVLLVEDNPDHAELIQRVLKRQQSVASVTAVTRGTEGLQMLSENSYSVVLLDYSLPGMDGLMVLKEIRRRGCQLPVVMVTSQGVERVAVEAMQEGASDYLIKAAGYLTTLPTMLSKVLKQHELQMENLRLLEKTRVRAQEQEALNTIATAVSRSLEVEGLLHLALDTVLQVTGRERGTILLLDPVTGEKRIVVHRGVSEEVHRAILTRRGKMDEVLTTDTPAVVNDPNDPELWEETRREGVHAMAWVPINSKGKAVGVLNVSTRLPIPFRSQEIELLQAIGSVIGVALENARLYAEATRRRHEAETLGEVGRLISQSLHPQEVQQRIVESLRAILGTQNCALFLQEPESGDLVAVGFSGEKGDSLDPILTLPRGSGMAGLALRERQPVATADILVDPRVVFTPELRARFEQAPFRSSLSAPLVVKERVIGALSVGDRLGRVFSREEIQLAQTFADQATLALENARLYEETERRAQEQAALNTIATAVSQSLNVEELLGIALDKVLEITGRERGCIRLRDSVTGEITLGAHRGISDAYAELLLSRRSPGGKFDQVLESGEPLVVNDPELAPIREETRREGNYAIAWFPLKARAKVLGILNVSTPRPIPFPPREVALLEAIANVIGVAIENARLFDEVRRSYEDLRQTQEHLVRAERLRALGEMAGGVAHDFNNLLAVILGRAQYLKMGLGQLGPEAVTRSLEIIEQSARDGAETVRHLFEFTRVAPAQALGSVNLNEIVTEAVAASEPRWKDEAEARGITVRVGTDLKATTPALGNGSQLREALLNLIFNAVEAMPEGGRLILATWEADDWVWLKVADQGIGMEEEVKKRVFEPFFTTKGPQRSGLGLSMVYGIISHHGGTITVESDEGAGTAFLIRLPRAEAPEPSPVASPVPEVPPSTVLVIDDEEAIRDTLADILGASGHTVVLAASGSEGLEWVGRQPFDLICTDLGMPGMSGWQVIDAVKALRPEVPVALITGWGVQVRPEELSAHHADFLLTKPFQISEVLTTLAKARARRNGAEN